MSESGDAGARPGRIHVPEPARRADGAGTDAGVRVDGVGDAAAGGRGPVARVVRRYRRELLVVLATFVLATVAVFVMSRDPGPGGRDVAMVGPAPGQAKEPYVAARRKALEDAAVRGGNRLAVASFQEPMKPEVLTEPGLPPSIKIVAVLVRGGGDDYAILDPTPTPLQAVEAWATAEQAELDAASGRIGEVTGASPSPSPAANWFEAEQKRIEQAAARVAVRSVIVGLILEGPAKELLAFQSRPGVVLVDLVPEGKSAGEIMPILVGG